MKCTGIFIPVHFKNISPIVISMGKTLYMESFVGQKYSFRS